MSTSPTWKHLARKPRSVYKQLFIKDRWIAARTLYGQTLGDDARTPEALAEDYSLPLEAVFEAIAYCESNPSEIREDWDREDSTINGGHAKTDPSHGAGNPAGPASITAGVKKS
jgi:uncharacterized protein (DUF433 family)